MEITGSRRLLSLKYLTFNVLTTAVKGSGLSCLQSACAKGDTETVSAILNNSPDKLASAIALSLKVGQNVSHFDSKSILTALGVYGSEKHKQISDLVETVTKDFQSQSLLHLASRKGEIEHIRKLLDFGEHVDSVLPGKSKETPLMLAARYSGKEIIEYLVERGASLGMQDAEGYTPLHHAVMGNKIGNISVLIQLGSDILTESEKRYSAIHLACINGLTKAVRLLRDHGAEVSRERGLSIGSPFTSAARNGHLEIIQLLVENGACVNKCGLSGWTALHHAVAGGHIHVVKYLLEKGANTMSMTRFKGRMEFHQSVLHLATTVDMFRLLVEHGADINVLEDYARPTLHVAAGLGRTEIVDYLLERGADINSRSHRGHSALSFAIAGDHDATIKLLIERGCDVGYCQADLLTLSARKGFKDVFQLLLKRGLSVDTIDSNGETPLIAAVEAGQKDMVDFLLDQEANRNQIIHNGN